MKASLLPSPGLLTGREPHPPHPSCKLTRTSQHRFSDAHQENHTGDSPLQGAPAVEELVTTGPVHSRPFSPGSPHRSR